MSAVDRFMAKVAMIPEAGCWLWLAAVQADTGYGRFGMPGNTVDYAHRAAWRLFVGPIPDGLYVCHKCDIRTCVNPQHLFLGTAVQNMKDAARKGRIVLPPQNHASDETHQVAKLTNDQVKEIRGSTLGLTALARKFNVTTHAIWGARTRRSFKDVA